MGNKSVEERCLDMAKHFSSGFRLRGTDCRENEQERPDFVFGSTGIEHFVADVIFPKTGKTDNDGLSVVDSAHRTQYNRIVKKIDYYRKYQDELERDIDNGKASQFIERIIKEQFDCMRDFDCNTFVSNFERVFNHHYEQVDDYIKNNNLSEIGFLIEIPYLRPLTSRFHHGFWIETRGKFRVQTVKTIPFPEKIVRLFEKAKKLDFIYVLLHPINFDGSYKECQFLETKPLTVKQDLCNQHVVICDGFKYPKINIELELNVDKSDKGEQ